MNNAMLAVIFGSILFTGCTMPAEVVDGDKNKIVTCTDTRDGEIFIFNTNSISNVRGGIAAVSSMDIVTTDGRKMNIDSGMEIYLKCVKSDK